MRSVASDRNVAGRRGLETWESMDTAQEKTRKGRSVQQERLVAPVCSRTTVVPHEPWQEVSDTASGNTSEISSRTVYVRQGKSLSAELAEIEKNCGAKPTRTLRNRVGSIIKKLQKEWRDDPNSLRLCLLVSKDIWKIETCRYTLNCTDGRFMKACLSSPYTDTLRPALQSLRDQIEAGRGWECHEKVDYLIRPVTRFLDTSIWSREECNLLIADLYRQLLCSEISYLEHIKDSPLPFSVRNSYNTIERTLSHESLAVCLDFLTQDETHEFKAEAALVLEYIKSNVDGDGAVQKRKSLEELRQTMFSETAGMWAARKYHDELRARLDEVMIKTQENNITDQQRVCLLETLIVFFEQYSDAANEFHTLREELNKLVIMLVKSILFAIAKDVDGADCWKAESLILIGNFYKENWPDEKYEILYLRCIQLQNVVGSAATQARMITLTFAQCLQQFDELFAYTKSWCENGAHWLSAADAFKQMHTDYDQLMTMLNSEDIMIKQVMDKSIGKLGGILYTALFANVFSRFKEYKTRPGLSRESLNKLMSPYQSYFIRTQPYLFMLYGRVRNEWAGIACCVWSDTLVRLGKNTRFDKNDIDSLLCLKEIAPSVDNPVIRRRLGTALLRLFHFMLKRSDTEYEFIEETMELSRWLDNLKETYQFLPLLESCCERWQKKYQRMMNAKAAAAPDTPAGIMPAGAHSDIAEVSLEAAGRHPHTRQEITPERTATRRSFQQSVSVSDSTPGAQSETAISPQLRSQQQSSFQQPMVLPEDKPGHPLVNDIQRMPEQSAGPVKQLRLSPESRALSQVPIQDKEYQQQSIRVARYGFTLSQPLSGQQSLDLPLPFEYPFGLSSSVFATDSALETCLRQYRPVEYTTHKMDNDNVVQGQRYLFCITRHYLQQKENGAYGSTPEMHFPASIGSCYYPAFMQGMAYLATWLLQINDGLVTQDDIYQPLMHLYDEDGDAMIRGLFDHLVKHQGRIGNFDIISNLFCFRNYLLFIRSLAGLRNDNQPASCSDKTGATCTVRQDTAGFAIEPDFVHDRTS